MFQVQRMVGSDDNASLQYSPLEYVSAVHAALLMFWRFYLIVWKEIENSLFNVDTKSEDQRNFMYTHRLTQTHSFVHTQNNLNFVFCITLH